MTAKEKVRAVYPKARHRRYQTNGGGGYTLIWADRMENMRLSSGKTTAEAWAAAAKRLVKA